MHKNVKKYYCVMLNLKRYNFSSFSLTSNWALGYAKSKFDRNNYKKET